MGPGSRQGGTSLIPWNGSKALIDFPGQPQETAYAATVAFSACARPMNRVQGAFDELRKFVLGPSERDPHGPTFH